MWARGRVEREDSAGLEIKEKRFMLSEEGNLMRFGEFDGRW